MNQSIVFLFPSFSSPLFQPNITKFPENSLLVGVSAEVVFASAFSTFAFVLMLKPAVFIGRGEENIVHWPSTHILLFVFLPCSVLCVHQARNSTKIHITFYVLPSLILAVHPASLGPLPKGRPPSVSLPRRQTNLLAGLHLRPPLGPTHPPSIPRPTPPPPPRPALLICPPQPQLRTHLPTLPHLFHGLLVGHGKGVREFFKLWKDTQAF